MRTVTLTEGELRDQFERVVVAGAAMIYNMSAGLSSEDALEHMRSAIDGSVEAVFSRGAVAVPCYEIWADERATAAFFEWAEWRGVPEGIPSGVEPDRHGDPVTCFRVDAVLDNPPRDLHGVFALVASLAFAAGLQRGRERPGAFPAGILPTIRVREVSRDE